MNKMKNSKKGLIISGAILMCTLGIFVLKNYLNGIPAGFKVPTPIDFILILPALPFLPFMLIFPDNIKIVTIISFIIAMMFWLFVGYSIGYYFDKRDKKR